MEPVLSSTSGINNVTQMDYVVFLERQKELILLLTPSTVVLFIFLLLGFAGNSFIFLFYSFKIKNKKDQENRVFIKYLSASDLMASTLGSSLGIAMNFKVLDFQNGLACTSLWFLTTVSVFCSGFLLVVISFQRFLMVCRPYGNQMNLFWKRMSMVGVFSMSIVVSFPTLFFIGSTPIKDQKTGISGRMCGKVLNTPYVNLLKLYDIIIIIIGYTGISVMTVLYFFVGRVILKQTKFRKNFKERKATIQQKFQEANVSVTETSKSDSTSARNSQFNNDDILKQTSTTSLNVDRNNSGDRQNTIKKEDRAKSGIILGPLKAIKSRAGVVKQNVEDLRFSIMFALISIVFVIAYSPRSYVMVREAINTYFWEELPNDEAMLLNVFLYRMYILNNVCNPFIYGAFDRILRKEFTKICSLCKNEMD